MTDSVANIFVKELDEEITPYVMDNSPPVLIVGYRCMEMGYTCVLPSGQAPYFVRLDGAIIHLIVQGYTPYLIFGLKDCTPQKTKGKLQLRCSSLEDDAIADTPRGVNADGGPNPILNKCYTTPPAMPSDAAMDEASGPCDESPEGDESNSDTNRPARRSLQEEANSLFHLLKHKPNNPCCESCRWAKMKETRKYVGSYVNTATRWGVGSL